MTPGAPASDLIVPVPMRALVVAALIAGVLIRIAILPIAVPAVDDSWRAWSFHAATRGPWNLYGGKGHTVAFAGIDAPVVYPPLALDEFALIGRAHLARTGGRFDDDVALTRTIKSSIALLDAALTALIFFAVRRAGGTARAWWAAMAYWLSPAVLMITTLGYVDVFMAIPAVGGLIAAWAGRSWLTGALVAAAIMTKPQAALIAPAAALALWNAGGAAGRTRLREAVTGGAITCGIIVAPLVAAGTLYYMARSVAVLARHDMLSALAFNLWWLVGYACSVAAARADGLRAALLAEPGVVTQGFAMAQGLPNPRAIAAVLLAAPVLWALKTAASTRDLGLQAALAAFITMAYFTLSVQVHENHFFMALPLLAIAAALRPVFAPVAAVWSVTSALNLYLTFGTRGETPSEFWRTITVVDSSIPVAVVTCMVFVWFGREFAHACAQTRDEPG